MPLTTSQYMAIMSDYDEIRRQNFQKEQAHKSEIYERIPQVKQIDEEIAHVSIQTTKEMMFHPSEEKKIWLRRRIKELSMEKVNLLAVHGYNTNYLDPIYHCPTCRDQGYVDGKKCYCFKQHLCKILFQQSNLEEIVKKENFSNFKLDLYPIAFKDGIPKGAKYKSPREQIIAVLKASDQFIQTFSSNPTQNLVIQGTTGVGKTFLSHCIARELIMHEVPVLYLTAHQLFERLEQYQFGDKKKNASILDDILNIDVLIIDDLGTEVNTTVINSQLFLCINERIIRRKSTIINTNLSPSEMLCLYTERVFSRIVQHFKFLTIYGDDSRLDEH